MIDSVKKRQIDPAEGGLMIWNDLIWCEGIGSRGHVVGCLERTSLDTSASVRGHKETMGLSSECGWLESCVYFHK